MNINTKLYSYICMYMHQYVHSFVNFDIFLFEIEVGKKKKIISSYFINLNLKIKQKLQNNLNKSQKINHIQNVYYQR